MFEQRAGLAAQLEKMEQYLNKVANNPKSEERLHFMDHGGFREFSAAFHEVMAIM